MAAFAPASPRVARVPGVNWAASAAEVERASGGRDRLDSSRPYVAAMFAAAAGTYFSQGVISVRYMRA